MDNNISYFLKYLVRDTFICDKILARLIENLNKSAVEIQEYTRRQLCKTLYCAVTHIPAYKNKIKLDHITTDTVERILTENFPILTKEELLENPDQYYPNYGRMRPWDIHDTTGGTTGAPLTVVRSLLSVIYENAFNYRHWYQFGFKKGMRRATLRGESIRNPDFQGSDFWEYNRFNKQLFFSTMHLTAKTADLFADKLQEFNPVLLEAFPSSAYDLAVYLREKGRRLNIPLLFTGSEPLYHYQRNLLLERIASQVIDAYGMSERVAFATECNYGELHVNTDYGYMEIVDESGSATADYGFVVGTSLFNFKMPLIRYQLSDLTKWKQGICRCNSPFPIIEPIKGRSEDAIFTPNGKDIGPFLYKVLKGIEEIRQCQIAQVSEYGIEIRVVPGPEFSHSVQEKMEQNFYSYVSQEMEVNVIIVDKIKRTARQKYRWIINEFTNGNRER